MKLSTEKMEQTLLLAGKLAVAARYVITANTKNISQRIEQMQEALNNYDGEIISETIRLKKQKMTKDEILQAWRKYYKGRQGIAGEFSDAEVLEQLAIEEYKEQGE